MTDEYKNLEAEVIAELTSRNERTGELRPTEYEGIKVNPNHIPKDKFEDKYSKRVRDYLMESYKWYRK